MEEQTDVVLFTSVQDIKRFLHVHPELSKYPTPISPFLFLPLYVPACMLKRRFERDGLLEMDWS
jgi:hypothetical protein